MLSKYIENLLTESNNAATSCIDTCTTLEMVQMINNEDKVIAKAIERILPSIAQSIDEAALRLAAGGRMIYFGAGTSGRLGIIDASECPATYGVPETMISAVIAGGISGIADAMQGDEDGINSGMNDVLINNVTRNDVVVGITASGRTPYVIGAITQGNEIGALTIGICNNPDTLLSEIAKITVAPITGPEVIQGSTRMKAGTAQKMVLNMLSTGVMIKLGKTYGNIMVGLTANNEKLYDRARRIVEKITGVCSTDAVSSLIDCDYDVKCAIVSIKLGCDKAQAKRLLDENQGHMSKVLD